MRARRFFDSFWGGLSGRVSSEVSSDVQLVACMGECAQIFWIRFGGATGFFNVMMQNCFYFVFAAALLHKVDRVMLSIPKTLISRRNGDNLCILRDPVAVSPFAGVILLIGLGLLPLGQ